VGVVFKGKDGLVIIIFKNTGCVLEMQQQHYLFIVSLGFMKGKLLDNCEFLLSPLTPRCLAKILVIFSSAINSFPDSYIFTVILFLLDCKCLG